MLKHVVTKREVLSFALERSTERDKTRQNRKEQVLVMVFRLVWTIERNHERLSTTTRWLFHGLQPLTSTLHACIRLPARAHA